MAVVIWPAELPQAIEIAGYQRTYADGRLRAPSERGPGKSRRASSAAVRPVAAVIIVELDGEARLQRFWDEDTASGSLPFLMPAQGMNGAALAGGDGAPLLTSDGAPILIAAWWLVKFGENPPIAAAMGGPLWRVTLDLEILP